MPNPILKYQPTGGVTRSVGPVISSASGNGDEGTPILDYQPGGGPGTGSSIPGQRNGYLYYWPDIENLTGSVSQTDLEAQDISVLPSESLIIVITGVDGDETHWRRMPDPGSPVTDLGLGIIVPINYDSATRPWVLLQELTGGGGGGGAVDSVFGRIGVVTALSTDYVAFYQPLDSDLSAIAALTTTAYGRGFLPLTDAAASRAYIGAGTSDFTQAVADALYAPIAHTHTFASLTSKPTSITGYGIVPVQADYDAFFLTPTEGNAAYAALAHTHTFASLTSKPTTLSGYGITDAEPALGNPSVNGYILSSTTGGVRSWIVPPTGGATTTGTGFWHNTTGTLDAASRAIDLSTADVTGNLDKAHLNSGTGATSSTFWRGDNTWATPAGGGNVSTSGTITTGQYPRWASATTLESVTTATVRTDLGLVIGTNVQAFDADLTTWAGITPTTVGQSFVTLANPGAITFPEISATNVVSAKTAAQLKTDLSLTATDVGLGNVTNNAQTQAAIVPNTAPTSGQILIGNVGNTAYAKNSVSGSGATITLGATGVLTISAIPESSLSITNVTTGDATTSAHGFAPKGTVGTTQFWRQDWTLATPGGTGTVTATGGALTANSVLLGAGTTDTKVVAGIITDGAAKLTLGVSTTSVGSIALNNLTSGSVTIQPATGALSTATMTIPAGSTNTVVADTGAANNFLTGISTAGVITKAQPTYANLTGLGGSTTQVLYNNAGAISSITGATTDGTKMILVGPQMSGSIFDANAVKLIALTATASAANWFGFANAALTFGPTITTAGGDTNINLNITPKGTGIVNIANGIQIGGSALNFSHLAGTATDAQVPDTLTVTAISNLTTNGFVKTGGAVGTLSVDTATYLTTNQLINLTGDVSGGGTTAITTTIGANKVTLGMMATMATDSILGRTTALTGNVEVLTALPWAYTGDVTKVADANALTIAANAVTYAKMQAVSTTSKLLGSSATTTPVQEITLGTNLSMSGTTLNATGGGGGGTSLSSTITQTSHGFAVGNVLQYTGTAYAKAQADAAANAEVVGLVTTVVDANNFTLTTGGSITGLSGLTAGSVYFLSSVTAGLLTTTVPTVSNQISKPLLIATSTTAGYFFNWRGLTIGAIAFSDLTGNWTLAQGPTTTASVLLGRTNTSSGVPQEITLGSGLSISGSTLNMSAGNVSNTGTPANNQLAVWTDATHIEGEPALTYTASSFLYTVDSASRTTLSLGNSNATSKSSAILWVASAVNQWLLANDVNATGGLNFFLRDMITSGNPYKLYVDAAGIHLPSVDLFGWSSVAAGGSGMDTAFARNATGVIEINNGVAGTYRDLKLRTLSITGATTVNVSAPATLTGAFLKDDGTWAIPGGAGNVSNSGVPTAGQMAQWVTSTAIKGVTLSGSGATMSIDTSGVLSISAIASASIVGTLTGKTLSTSTFDNTNTYTAKDGSFTLQNTTTTTKQAIFSLANITAANTRTITIPDANSNTVIPDTGAANNFLTAIASTGVISKAQPTPTNVGLGNVTNAAQTLASVVPNTLPAAGQLLIGNAGATAYAPVTMGTDATITSAGALTIANNAVTLAKMATMATDSILGRATAATGNVEVLTALPFAFTGDVTRAIDSNVTVLANIPDLTPAVGSILFTNIAAPVAPASTKDKVWFDTTDQRLHEKNTAGTIGTTVVADTGAASNFLTAISAAGVISKAQPAFSNLSGSATAAQMPAFTGDVTSVAGATANTLVNIPATTTIGGVAGTRGDVLYYGASGWAKLAAGTSGNQLTTNGAGADPTWAAPGAGGSGSPGGSDTYVQFNNAGAFGGDAGLTYLKASTTQAILGLGATGGTLWWFGTGGSVGNAGYWTGSQLGIYNGSNTNIPLMIDSNNVYLCSSGIFGWQSAGRGGTLDTGLYRNAAGVVEINNGTAGTYRDLKARTYNATSGYQINGTATAGDYINSSVSSQSPAAVDVYVTGSSIVVPAGGFAAKGQYRCVFDIVKSAGTGTIVVSLRIGTTGTVASDTARITFTFPAAGTTVADTGNMEVCVNWRTVGSGTSAVVAGFCRAAKNTITAAGLWSTTSAALTIVGTVSGGFDSSAATTIGLSFNGSTAFAGTITTVQATLAQ